MIQIPFGAFANVSVPADVDVTVAVPQADPLNFLTAQQPFQIVVFTAPAAEGGGGGVTSWNDLEDKPTSFPPSAHDQGFGTITGVDQHKLLGRHANGAGAAQQIGLDGGLEFNGGNIRVQFGTSGTTACVGNDARLSDARAPTGSAGGDLGGTYPNPTVSAARGIRETAGPTVLAVGAIADGGIGARVGSAFVGAAGAAWNNATRSLAISGATLTASAPILNLSQTWNNGAEVFSGCSFSVTDTASAARSRILTASVGSESNLSDRRFAVEKDGALRLRAYDGSYLLFIKSVPAACIHLGSEPANFGDFAVHCGNSRVQIGNGAFLVFSSGTAGTLGGDVFLGRDAANALAQRNGTNAQTSRIYNTWTNASNGEWLNIGWASNVCTIETQANGTGTARPLRIRLDRVAFSTLPTPVAGNAGLRVSVTDCSVNPSGNYWVIASGGGSFFANLTSDGTNWRIG